MNTPPPLCNEARAPLEESELVTTKTVQKPAPQASAETSAISRTPQAGSGLAERFFSHPRAPLTSVITTAVIVRLLFLLVGASIFWGKGKYLHADARYYAQAAVNLVDHGILSSELTYPDATFARVPGYSLFWAPFYAIFGYDSAYVAVAIVQSAADALSVYLIFDTMLRATNVRVATVSAFLYAVYPFAIVWTVTSNPDTLSNLFVFATFFLLSKYGSVRASVMMGVFLGIAVLTREYLGLLLPSVYLYWWLSRNTAREWFIKCTVATLAFVAVFSLWPARNYVNHGQLVLFRSKSSGSHYYTTDVKSCEFWLTTWTDYPNGPFQEIVRQGWTQVPEYVTPTPESKELAMSTMKKAHECGSGFQMWAHNTPRDEAESCNDEIEKGFSTLTKTFKEAHPFLYYSDVPMKGLYKAIFKADLNDLWSPKARLAAQLAFAGRTSLLLFGLLGLFQMRKINFGVAILPFCAGILWMMLFMVRAMQIRYLLQVDSLLLLPAGYAIWQLGTGAIEMIHSRTAKKAS